MLTRYKPSLNAPWSIDRIVHLHRRAGFAANWGQIERDLKDGPDIAIERLLRPTHNEEFEQISKVICDAAVTSENIHRLQAWWLYRMLQAPSSRDERMTLLWHNHFATSYQKLQNVGLMRNQNDLFRQFGNGPFADLLSKVIRDPAMLIWLDADSNRKTHPNENLAREIMELFTLATGPYNEMDVKEAARALTGWTVNQKKFHFNRESHDSGIKTILGHQGQWDGDDLLRMLVSHPETSVRLARRICQQLMGDDATNEQLVREVATHLRDNDLIIGLAFESLLRSESFFASNNFRNQVRGPVEWTIDIFRALELINPMPTTLLLAEWTKRLGHDLFSPSSVFGWPGGKSWLTSRAMIGRANFVAAISEGRLHMNDHRFDARALAEKYGFSSLDQQQRFYTQLLTGVEQPHKGLPDGLDINEFVRSLLTTPELQIS